MKLDPAAIRILLQETEIPWSMGDADLAIILEARGIRALHDDGRVPLDRSLAGLQPERLRRAAAHPGNAAVRREVERHLRVLRDTLEDDRILASQAAIADALDTRDGWWLRAVGMRAVGREEEARRVVDAIRSADAFLMADEEAFEVVAHLAQSRCEAAQDPSMTIWRLVAAWGEDIERVDEDADAAHPEAERTKSSVYRTPPRPAPLVLVARDGKIASAALAELVAGRLDAEARKVVQSCLAADAGERARLEAHRQAFAARERARTEGPAASDHRGSVEWVGKVILLQRGADLRMTASSATMSAYSKQMGFELVPEMGDGGDTHVVFDAWVDGAEVACRLEVWAQHEEGDDHALYAVYPLRTDAAGRVSCALPLMSLTAASVRFRLVRD